jgi:hypothetical protein
LYVGSYQGLLKFRDEDCGGRCCAPSACKLTIWTHLNLELRAVFCLTFDVRRTASCCELLQYKKRLFGRTCLLKGVLCFPFLRPENKSLLSPIWWITCHMTAEREQLPADPRDGAQCAAAAISLLSVVTAYLSVARTVLTKGNVGLRESVCNNPSFCDEAIQV